MIHFNFVASDNFSLEYFKDEDQFIAAFPDFQTAPLNNEGELNLLTQLLGITELNWVELDGLPFSHYCDISDFKLPELSESQFDKFYLSWIEQSKRENDMNEYGSLIFLQGLTENWNKRKYRLIVMEK